MLRLTLTAAATLLVSGAPGQAQDLKPGRYQCWLHSIDEKTKTVEAACIAGPQPPIVLDPKTGKAIPRKPLTVKVTLRVDDQSEILLGPSKAKLVGLLLDDTGHVQFDEKMRVVSLHVSHTLSLTPAKEELFRGTLESRFAAPGLGVLVVNATKDGKEGRFRLQVGSRVLRDGLTVTHGALERGVKVDVYYTPGTDVAHRVLTFVKEQPPDLR